MMNELVLRTHQEEGYGTVISLSSGAAIIAAAPFTEYWRTLRTRLWVLALFSILGAGAAYLISRRLQPIYESTAMIEIDRGIPSGIVGGQASRIIDFPDDDVFMTTQIKLIQSDAVLRAVADKFGLCEFKDSRQGCASSPVELKIRVSRPPNTRLLQIRYGSTEPELAARIANSIAQSYVDLSYANRLQSSFVISHYVEKQMREQKSKMDTTRLALAKYEKDLGLVNAQGFENGDTANELDRALAGRRSGTNLVAVRLLQLNKEYTQAHSDRLAREAAFHMVKNGNLDPVPPSGSESLEKLVQGRNEARENLSQIQEQVGVGHEDYRRQSAVVNDLEQKIQAMPQVVASIIEVQYQQALEKERMLAASLAATKAESDQLITKRYDYERLERAAIIDSRLYDQLEWRVTEAGINSAFRSENIRVVDPARPARVPIFPNFTLNVIVGFMLGCMLSAWSVIARGKMKDSVNNEVGAADCPAGQDGRDLSAGRKSHVVSQRLPLITP